MHLPLSVKADSALSCIWLNNSPPFILKQCFGHNSAKICRNSAHHNRAIKNQPCQTTKAALTTAVIKYVNQQHEEKPLMYLYDNCALLRMKSIIRLSLSRLRCVRCSIFKSVKSSLATKHCQCQHRENHSRNTPFHFIFKSNFNYNNIWIWTLQELY